MIRLNPCCNGIWSRTLGRTLGLGPEEGVLILVVMEYGCNRIWSRTFKEVVANLKKEGAVLILVAMEYGLGLASARKAMPKVTTS